MLRGTVSRVKKVYTGAIPRILRGDPCGGSVSYAVVTKSFKSTKSTNDDKRDSLTTNEDYVRKKSEATASPEDKTTTQFSRPVLTASIPLTQRERCQRIIDKAFGACEHTDSHPELTEEYFSRTVNLEQTRREILEAEEAILKSQEQVIDNPLLPDSRTHYGLFKMNRELITDENHDENITQKPMSKGPPAVERVKPAVREDIVKTMTYNIAAAKEPPDMNKNVENAGSVEETVSLVDPYITNAKDDVDKYVNNPESFENKALRDDDPEKIEIVKDDRKKNLYQKATREEICTLLPYNRTQLGAYTLNRGEQNDDENIIINSTSKEASERQGSKFANRKDIVTNGIDDVERCVKGDLETTTNKVLRDDDYGPIEIDKDEKRHMFINATTANEDEEQLAQKLETIEETPIVEAQIPKLEGFNVTPKVLGDKPVLNSKSVENNEDNSAKADLPGALDDMAKRCLNSPLGQIDEILLNEMERYPFNSKTENKAPSKSLLGDILVQMDELKGRPNGVFEVREIRSERPKLERGEETAVSNEPYAPGFMRPTRHINFKSRLSDLKAQSEEMVLIRPKKEDQLAGRAVQPFKDDVENASPVMDSKLNEATVTEIQVLGIHSVQDSNRTKSVQTTKAQLSDDHIAHYLREKAKCALVTAEVEKTDSKVTSLDTLNDASDNIHRYKRGQIPEYMTHMRGFPGPSCCSTVNTSNYANVEPQSKEPEMKSAYSRNLYADEYISGHKKQIPPTLNTRYLQHVREKGETERQGQIPQGHSTDEVVIEHHETTATRGFERVPYSNFYFTDKRDKILEHLQKVKNATPLCNRDATVESQQNPGQEYIKVSIADEILKEHMLDPYYVLTCNETCPIAPASTLSTYNSSDFVDTTETIYMKKNIIESLRPQPSPTHVKMASEESPSETQTPPEFDEEFEPEVIPDLGYTVIPDHKSTSTNALGSLSTLSEKVSLSELLETVRQRSRLECLNDLKALGLKLEPAVGKCRTRSPRCLPTAPRAPPNNRTPPLPFGLPMLKRRPPVCKAPKKKPGCKYSTCDMDVSCGVQTSKINAYELNDAEFVALKPKTDLTELVAEQLNNLGNAMSGVLRKVKSSTETLFARDYDPWAPIPSWPTSKKVEKKWQPATPFKCGCPLYPKARACMKPDPPCEVQPCQGFPKRRSFSMLDCLAVSLHEIKPNEHA